LGGGWRKLKLKDTITNTGAMATGLAMDAEAKRIPPMPTANC
jgi:hypothetical protein